MRIIKDLAYGNGLKNTMDVYLPDFDGFKTFVHFHGGGIEVGDKGDACYVELAKQFIELGYGFATVNYSLYPTAKYPTYLTETATAVAFVKNKVTEWGGNGDILITGQSAGAWISLMLCLNGEWLRNVGVNVEDIKGWIIDSAQTTSHFNVIKYEKGLDSKKQLIDEFAPLYYVSDDTRFSKMLIVYYTNDIPCRPEQNKLFVKAVKNFNPKADIESVELFGTHCQGSTSKGEDGIFPFIKVSEKWLKDKNLL